MGRARRVIADNKKAASLRLFRCIC